MSRRAVALALAAVAAALAAVAAGLLLRRVEPGAGRPGPNVLLIVLDTARADHLSCADGFELTTPRLCRFAGAATRFRSAYSTSFWTLPAHATLLTGLFPSEAGATSETNHLPAEVTTLAERLAPAGWTTGAVVRNAWLSEERGFRQGFADYVEAWRGDSERTELAGERWAVEQAVGWLEARAAATTPFFLFVNLNVAHLPYDPPPEVRQRFLAPDLEPAQVERLMKIRGGWAHLAGADPLEAADLRVLGQLYRAELALADELAGRLLDALDELTIRDETLVIVTSDHGENLGEHGLIDHVQSMYETTVRVPLLLGYRERFRPGAVDDSLVSLIDLVPTVLDVCGLGEEIGQLPARGSSLADPRRPRDRMAFAENARPLNGLRRLGRFFPRFDAASIDHPLRMVRDERFKLIWRVDRGAELYDLAADPDERLDLAAGERERRDAMLLTLRGWVSELRARPVRRFVSRDRESLEKLRALGYLE